MTPKPRYSQGHRYHESFEAQSFDRRGHGRISVVQTSKEYLIVRNKCANYIRWQMLWYIPLRMTERIVRPRREKERKGSCVALEVLERAKNVMAIVVANEDDQCRFVCLFACFVCLLLSHANPGRPSVFQSTNKERVNRLYAVRRLLQAVRADQK